MATAGSDGQAPCRSVRLTGPVHPRRYAQRAGPLQYRVRLGHGHAGLEEIAARQLL